MEERPMSGDTRHIEQEREAIRKRLGRIKHKLVVLSGKGGVGKTTVAVNLSVALAKNDTYVGLMDIDLHGPNVPKMLGVEGKRVGGDEESIHPYTYSDNLRVLSISFFLKERGDAVIWRGPLKMIAIKQFIKDVNWGDLDWLVIDAPPGTGDEPLSILQLVEELDGVIIVTTPQEVSLLDVMKCVTFCEKLGVRILGVVENMASLVCPHCGGEILLFGKRGRVKEFAKDADIPFLGEVPFEPSVVEASDTGVPTTLKSPETAAAEAFFSIAEKIKRMVEEEE